MYQVKNIMWRNNYWIERIGFWDQIEENEEGSNWREMII